MWVIHRKKRTAVVVVPSRLGLPVDKWSRVSRTWYLGGDCESILAEWAAAAPERSCDEVDADVAAEVAGRRASNQQQPNQDTTLSKESPNTQHSAKNHPRDG